MRFLSHKSTPSYPSQNQTTAYQGSLGQSVSGTLNEALSHRREIFKPVIVFSAFVFIMVHNHLIGDLSRSEADLRLTRRIVQATGILQLQLVHHVIIGSTGLRPEELVHL